MTSTRVQMPELAILLLSAILCGCGGGGDVPPLGTVSGTVTFDGEPLADAEITFQPENGRPSVARTDSSGQYSLDYSGQQQGAVVGNHTVIITTAREAFSDESGQGKDVAARKEILPVRYHAMTELTATVNPGSNTIDFELEAGGPTEMPKVDPRLNP